MEEGRGRREQRIKAAGGCGARAALLLATGSLWATAALAQSPVRYEVEFSGRAHHEARVSATFPGVPAAPLQVRMSRSSPGRYSLHEFARNVYGVHAYDGAGRELRVTRPNPHEWDVPGHDGTVRFEYILFGDRADGTYTGIDRTHAHLNLPATFAWARGLDARPIVVTFHLPPGSGWRIATQLAPTEDPERFTAPNLQVFMDSPTEIAPLDIREWSESADGRSARFRLAMHHLGTPAELSAYAELTARVVREERAVFGEFPTYDFGTYTFIADYLPTVVGDGMEHRNSTFLVSTTPLATGALANLRTVSHEFFHSWNMERIRSRELEPFDFERANMSDELWFGEGFTSYYDDLVLLRAGIIRLADYARAISRDVNSTVNSPARRYFSPIGMSRQAPFQDRAGFVAPDNGVNTFLSYYTWGAALGLGLDLTLRSRFPGVTLDDYMRAMWREHGKREVPYDVTDLERTLARISGDAEFAHDFFERYVRGREVVDFAPLLARAGLDLRKVRPGAAFVGELRLETVPTGGRIAFPTRAGEPMYAAGLDRGDVIVTLAGHEVRSDADLQAALASLRPGQRVEAAYITRGGMRAKAAVTVGEDPALEVVSYEAAGLTPTEEMLAFRRDWLATRQRAKGGS